MKKLIAKILVAVMLLSAFVCLSACNNTENEALTPYIGENGNWWIGDTDTNVSATGPKGDKGDAGKDGAAGANGENGAAAPTPALRYNPETEVYEISFDGGVTWTVVENYTPVVNEPENEPNNPNVNKPTINPDDAEAQSYEYPVDTIVPVQGAIAYATDHVYKDEAKTKFAFIDLDALGGFDTVSFEVIYDYDDPWVCFAFLTEMPELGEMVTYAEGYSTFKFACYDCKADIPADAKYLAFYYSYDDSEKGTISYLPASITFTKGKTVLENLQDGTLEAYDLPMEYLVADHAVINYFGKDADKDKFIYHKNKDDECKVAVIDITDTVFESVILTPADREDTWMGYTFLTELPEIGELVSYANGYDTVEEYTGEIEIPENAKYLVVYYMDNYNELYYPGGIRFEK